MSSTRSNSTRSYRPVARGQCRKSVTRRPGASYSPPARPAVVGRALGIVYRCIATHLIKKAGFSRKTAETGAVTLIQRLGSALTKSPKSGELAHLTQTLARRIGLYLERQGPLERDAENSYPAGDGLEAGPLDQTLGSSITYRIALGPLKGRKVFTLPACDEPFAAGVGKVTGFSPAHRRGGPGG